MDDGTARVEGEAEQALLEWLQAHGAQFPKLEWPSRATVDSVRGAVALEDIESDEVMLSIPEALILSVPRARSHPPLQPAIEALPEMFRQEDMVLALFIMYEKAQGADSFWHPYIASLPTPLSIADWPSEDLAELQDPVLMDSAQKHNEQLELLYNLRFQRLRENFPEVYDNENFSFEEFKFAWNTVQARAFGRWLPWTALVPFADCLNHTNVSTQYDYNVDGNGMFRLFPTNGTRYAAGTEAFNCYGPRSNEQLLMDYGFALHNNTHDSITVQLNLAESDPLYGRKRTLLFQNGFMPRKGVRLRPGVLSQGILSFHRAVVMTEADLPAGDPSEFHSLDAPLNLEHEERAIRASIACVEQRLAEFPTTLEDDRAIEASGNLAIAITYRTSCKWVLRNQIELLNDLLLPVVTLLRMQDMSLVDMGPISRYLAAIGDAAKREHDQITAPPPPPPVGCLSDTE